MKDSIVPFSNYWYSNITGLKKQDVCSNSVSLEYIVSVCKGLSAETHILEGTPSMAGT